MMVSTVEENDNDGDDGFLWNMPPELVYGVIAFLDGKAVSSLMEALLASRKRRASPHSSPLTVMCYILGRLQDDTIRLLSTISSNSQPALVQFVKEAILPKTNALQLMSKSATTNTTTMAPIIIREFSENCLLLDYVLQGPRNATSLTPDQMLWPIGVGVFKTSPVCGGHTPLQTKVVLSCPLWNPAAVLAARDVWLPEKTYPHTRQAASVVVGAPTHFSWLPSEGDIDGFDPHQNMAVLQPFNETNIRSFQAAQALSRDDDFLSAMGRTDSCLSILPAVDCPIYGSLLDYMIRSSSSSSNRGCEWLLDEQIKSLNQTSRHQRQLPRMLCFFDNHQACFSGGDSLDQANDDDGQSNELVDQIMYLMKTLQGGAANCRRALKG